MKKTLVSFILHFSLFSARLVSRLSLSLSHPFWLLSFGKNEKKINLCEWSTNEKHQLVFSEGKGTILDSDIHIHRKNDNIIALVLFPLAIFIALTPFRSFFIIITTKKCNVDIYISLPRHNISAIYQHDIIKIAKLLVPYHHVLYIYYVDRYIM